MIQRPTSNQLVVLELILRGYDINEIPAQLNRSIKMVEIHVQNLREIFHSNTIIGMIVESARYNFLYDHLSAFRENGILIHRNDVLDDLEKDILHEILKGNKNKEIAKTMDMSVRQVEHYRGKVYSKWAVDSKVDLVIKAITKNYLKMELITPLIDANDKDEVLNMYLRKPKASKIIPAKYKLLTSEPSRAILNLSQEQFSITKLLLAGKNMDQISRSLQIGRKRAEREYGVIMDIWNVQNAIEFVLRCVRSGVVVVDNWQDYRIKTLTDEQVSVILKVASISVWNRVEKIRIKGVSTERAEMIVKDLLSLWKVSSIEGLLVQALRRGDLDFATLYSVSTDQEIESSIQVTPESD